MSEQYPLTLDHVKQFLATKNDDDELGICYNAMYCLLSETLNWLYPEQKPWRVDFGTYATHGISYGLVLDESLNFLRSAFDYSSSWPNNAVTKEKFRKRLEFLASKQEGLIEENKMPFTVADVFPEKP